MDLAILQTGHVTALTAYPSADLIIVPNLLSIIRGHTDVYLGSAITR